MWLTPLHPFIINVYSDQLDLFRSKFIVLIIIPLEIYVLIIIIQFFNLCTDYYNSIFNLCTDYYNSNCQITEFYTQRL